MVIFPEYARLNPYWRAYNEDGSIKEIMGDYELANIKGPNRFITH